MELSFAGRNVDLTKKLITLGLAVRLVELKYNVLCNKIGVKSEEGVWETLTAR